MDSEIVLHGRKKTKKFHIERGWFYQKYSVELVPTWKLAQEIGCVENHISAIADMLGIPRRGRLGRTKDKGPRIFIDLEEAARLYFGKELNANAVGEILGCSGDVVRRRLVDGGYKLRHHNDTKRGKPSKNKILLDSELVVSMYAEMYASAQTVGDHFGVSHQVIHRILKEQGVSRKPIGEARNMWGENGPNWKPSITNEEREQRRDMASQARWREKVYKRDNYTCQKCKDATGGNLNAHHIIPHSADRSMAWDLDNGITLCKSCHYAFHNQYGYTKCTAEDLEIYLEDVKTNSKTK